MWLFRPKPKFDVGQLVHLISVLSMVSPRYMSIRRRRWIVPNGGTTRRWVYDGTIYEVQEGEMVWATYGSCWFEEHLAPIPE